MLVNMVNTAEDVDSPTGQLRTGEFDDSITEHFVLISNGIVFQTT